MSMESVVQNLTEYRRETERELEQIKHALAALNGTGNGIQPRTGMTRASPPGETPRRNVLSISARRRISLAQKARWAKLKKTA